MYTTEKIAPEISKAPSFPDCAKFPGLLLTASSETQGQIVGARESLNRRKNKAQKNSKERPEEPLGTMSYQTSSKRSPPFWLLIGGRKTCVFLAPIRSQNGSNSLELVW